MKNQIQLITYVDRIACKTIAELNELLQFELNNLFGGVHILPFFYPIDGEDAGFDPIDHTLVDPRLGDWNDVKKLSKNLNVMADLIVNHISSDSKEFKDYLKNGAESKYASLILTQDKVFPNGTNEQALKAIYRPRPGLPFTPFQLADGTEKMVWTTFTKKQIDIDVNSDGGRKYLEGILELYEKAGITMIRLDAAGYAIKKEGTNCFMIPETFDFIDKLTQKAHTHGIEVLVEIHSFYKTQIEIASKVDYVYDFALPVLVLDTLFNKTADNLKNWLRVGPKNVVTVLDTHDGIGIVDVASEGAESGLIPDPVLDKIVTKIHENSQGRSLEATGSAASNLDLYQVNCTYFEALGKNEKLYLMARAIQFFVPGIPQFYYVGLFGDDNDMELLPKTNVGRDINRHYYTKEELVKKMASPLFKKLTKLIRIRNTHTAFNGTFELLQTSSDILAIQWVNGSSIIRLEINLSEMHLKIEQLSDVDNELLFSC